MSIVYWDPAFKILTEENIDTCWNPGRTPDPSPMLGRNVPISYLLD